MEEHLTKALWPRYGKRAFDAVLAAILLVLVSPLLLTAYVLIKTTSRGPAFFSQERAGRYGDPFRVYKFRTMYAHHRHDENETITLAHPGITPVGSVLRRLKIDELPQIYSVLTGTMSLVGPRPGLVSQAEAYDEVERRRLLVRPGCTGLAQVNTMSRGADWTERIRYDVYYVDHCTFWLDLMILAKTPLIVLFGESHFDRPFATSPYAKNHD